MARWFGKNSNLIWLRGLAAVVALMGLVVPVPPGSFAFVAPRAKKSKQRSTTPQWVQKKSNSATANTNNIATGAFASTTTTGNLIVCGVRINSGTATVSSVSDSAGNSYAKAKSISNAIGMGYSLEVWYKENITGGASVSVTATFSATLNVSKGITCHEYSGVVTSGALDQTASSAGWGGVSYGGAVTTTTDNQLIFSDFANSNSYTVATGNLRDNLNNDPTIDRFVGKRGTYEIHGMWDAGWSSLIATFKGSGTPTWRQKAETAAGSGNSTTVQTAAFGSNPLAGSLMVCTVHSAAGSISVNSVTDTAGNTYSQAVAIANSNPWEFNSIWYAYNITGGASFKVTATYSGSVGPSRIITCHEYTGMSTTNPLDQTSVANGQGNPASSAVTTTQASELLFNYISHYGPGSASVGWNLRSGLNNDIYQDKIVSSTGTYRSTFDEVGNFYWGVTATFKLISEPNPITLVHYANYPDWFTSTNTLIMPPMGGLSASIDGNAIICHFDYASGTASVTSVTDTAGNTYSRAGSINRYTGGNSGRSGEIWYSAGIKGAAYNQVTATLSAAGLNYKFGMCQEYEGLARAPLDQTASSNTLSTTNFSAGPMTTTSRYQLLVGEGICANGSASEGSNFYGLYSGDLQEFRIVNSIGSYSVPGISGGSSDCAMTAASFKGAVNNPNAPAVAYIQSTNTALSGSSPASVNVSFSSQPRNGNFVVVKILQSHSSTPTITSVTDNNGNTYSTGCSYATGASNARAAIYYSKLTSVSTSPLTITVSGTATKWTVNAQEYSGLTTLDQTVTQGSGTATNNPWTSFSPETTSDDELVSAITYISGSFASITASGYTNRLLNSNTTYAPGSSDDRIATGKSTFFLDWWTDTTNAYTACMATFK